MPSYEDWLKKMWYFYTMEYYSAIKNDKLEDFIHNWMYLEDILISEINQIDTCKYCIVSLGKNTKEEIKRKRHSTAEWK